MMPMQNFKYRERSDPDMVQRSKDAHHRTSHILFLHVYLPHTVSKDELGASWN